MTLLFKAIEIPHFQKIEYLEEFEWSDDLNPVQIGTVADCVHSVTVPAGITILQEGETHAFFCLLCEGHVEVIKENHSGSRKQILTLGPGKSFGEMSFFDGEACSASVIAKEEVILFLIDKDKFKILCDDSPAVALQIALNTLSSVSRRLRQTTGRLVDFL